MALMTSTAFAVDTDVPGKPWAGPNRINPHEHSVNRQELLAHLIGDVVVINRRLGINAKCCQLFEDAVKAIALGSCRSPPFPVAAPENRDFLVLYVGHIILLGSPRRRVRRTSTTDGAVTRRSRC
jgi:hypothetical protein